MTDDPEPVNRRPTLIVVNGPPATGKTTRVYALGRAVSCVTICGDDLGGGHDALDAPDSRMNQGIR